MRKGTKESSPEQIPTSPSPQISPMPHKALSTPQQSPLQSRSRTSSVFKSPTSPGKMSKKRQHHDGETADNVSEMCQSEASEATTQQDQTMLGQPWGTASKRANKLMLLAQSHKPSALTPEALSGLSQGPPSANLRSSHRLLAPSFALPPAPLPRSQSTVPKHQTSIWDFAGGAGKKAKPDVGTAEKYVRCALDNGDGADLLRLSCALGHLERFPSHHGSDAVSAIEDAEFHCLSQFRNVAGDLIEAAVAKSSDFPSFHKLLVEDALALFAEGAIRLGDGEGVGTSFLWQVAGQDRCKLNSHALTTFALCMMHFLREATAKMPDVRLPSCRAFVSRARAWVGLREPGGGEEEVSMSGWRHFDLRGGRVARAVELDESEVFSGVGIYGGVVHGGPGWGGGEGPMRFLGVLLDAFWQKVCEVGSAEAASRWLTVLLEEDEKKDVGLRLSVPFVRACADRVHQGIISGKPIPKLKALAASPPAFGGGELDEAYTELSRACGQTSSSAGLSGAGSKREGDFAAPLVPRQAWFSSPPKTPPRRGGGLL